MKISKLSSLAIISALLPTTTLAAGIDILRDITKTGQAIYGPNAQPAPLTVIISNLVQVILSFLGIIFLLLIIYAGIRWMTSEGNEKTIEEAKNTLRSSVIGLTIVLAAYSIAAFITTSLLKAI